MKTLRLGSRKSALAQAQVKWATEHLRRAFPELHVELVLIATSGDASEHRSIGASETSSPAPRRPDAPTPTSGGLKALFTKEIEEALLDNKIDLAVHSLKDMAAELPKGLVIGAVCEREDPRDVWISRKNLPFKQISEGDRIGTGSVRRQAQLIRLLPKAELVAIRGNVDTRLRKLMEGEWDGIVLALAGLRRLGRQTAVTEVLAIEQMLPAVGQGCLAVECRESDQAMAPYLKILDHAPSHQAALAERAFLQTLGGSCQTPIAGYAHADRRELLIQGLVVSPDGQTLIRDQENGSTKDPAAAGRALAQKLLAGGADRILKGFAR